MNWDISIGHLKQWSGRILQTSGHRMSSRKMVLDGEAMEYAGRLQMRYGMLKHQAQWGGGMTRDGLRPVASRIVAKESALPTAHERLPG